MRLLLSVGFQNLLFQIILSERYTFCIQTRINILLVLIWVQTVCKGYQQMTKVAASKERVDHFNNRITDNSKYKLWFPGLWNNEIDISVQNFRTFTVLWHLYSSKLTLIRAIQDCGRGQILWHNPREIKLDTVNLEILREFYFSE